MFQFFIDRPIFSTVLSVLILIAGGVSLYQLPVEQYPKVVPPQIVVQASFPGASAQVIADTVSAPLEQAINGVDDMLYMESFSGDAGSMRLTVHFQIGTDPDQATIDVNNRVQRATAQLPQQVRDLGVEVQARSTSILQVIALSSKSEQLDTLEISNYALLNVLDELVRLPGVGDARLFGAQDYSMRIWLRPDKLAEFDLTPSDVAAAMREQNAQFAAGRIGAEPAPEGQAFTYSVSTPERMTTPKEFEQIILRSDEDGSTLRLGDVARAELGAESYDFSATFDAKSAVPIGIYLQPDANALDTAQVIREAMEEISQRFPADLQYDIPYDTTRFIDVSIREVVITFIQALALVVLVTFLFLQHMKATLIPLVAIPVSLIGTFAGMQLMGFSINLLTLFGLILAIGVVVDNAIIVMENAERLMKEEGLSSYEAASKTMKQVSGAVVGSTLVLVAVFAPVAFLGGLSGELYRQFAITIAVSVALSGVVALTLSPVMCALLLDREQTEPSPAFAWFNDGFDRLTDGFVGVVGWMLRHAVIALVLFVLLISSTVFLMSRMATGLVPQEDQGFLLTVFQLPPVSAMSRTEVVREELSRKIGEMEEISGITAFAGFDILNGGLRTNTGVGFVTLIDWDDRTGENQNAASMADRIVSLGADIPEAEVLAFVPPPISGLSLTGGVEGYLQLRGNNDPVRLKAEADRLVAAAEKRPELVDVRAAINIGVPRYKANVDWDKAKAMGVAINDIFTAMSSTFGSLYVNDFTLEGRNWQVNMQSEGDFRSQPDDLRKVFVRSGTGELVPLSTVVSFERTQGVDSVSRFNLYPATKISADPAPGYNTGAALAALQEVGQTELSEQAQLGWIGEAYQLLDSASAGGLAFGMGILMVFLILSAQYERWSLPLAVATAIPFGVFGAVVASLLRGFPNDIYFQVGLLVLIGLAAKNAILIVEFAAQNRKEGMSAFESALVAARQRFRAIMMTALTFIIGSLPLAISTGAGAVSRQEIGTVVVGGMIAASTLALIFVPVFYMVLEQRGFKRREPV
ncbi:MAG TPA: multidrug efflux RND transporter permease subunit [Pseudomonas xinjiangensis]|uniref:Efflux pump membrane transporter n=2 Tax=root TaxID=1 RepID=A0A7V1BPS7_9GAMM|nr:multidrug efflux RND transporter permease subunit [Halopseudomonas xinjiangensis]HEC49354.1 multidrug efflux RND transporter permease subunit [Halopseudomonas xinjiangensis]